MELRFQGQDYSKLHSWLNHNWGSRVEFENGCSVWLEDDSGMIWRTDPYGQDGGCNCVDGWEKNIQEWLKYWDDPRTETGSLILE